jgi:hypothetical protein
MSIGFNKNNNTINIVNYTHSGASNNELNPLVGLDDKKKAIHFAKTSVRQQGVSSEIQEDIEKYAKESSLVADNMENNNIVTNADDIVKNMISGDYNSGFQNKTELCNAMNQVKFEHEH